MKGGDAMGKIKILILVVLLLLPAVIYGSPKLFFGVHLDFLGLTYGEELAGGVRLWLGLNKYFAVELNVARYSDKSYYLDRGAETGALSSVPLELNIQGRLPITKWLVPFVSVGGGYTLNHFELSADDKADWAFRGKTMNFTVDNAFSFLIGSGLDFFITPKFMAHISMKYQISKAKAASAWVDLRSGQEGGGDLDPLRLDAIMFIAGLSYSF
jgi:hypothetical protein